MHIFSQDSNIWSDVRNPTPPLNPPSIFGLDSSHTNPCLSSVIINFNIFPVFLFLPLLPIPYHIPYQDDVKPMKTYIAHTNIQQLRENSKSASTKRGSYLKETQTECKPEGNLYRDTGSVYFCLINVN